MAQLSAGMPAPALELANQDGSRVSLADHRGGPVVVYFYPKAFTPGCTSQACDFRDNLAALKSRGVTVLGVSADDVDQLRAFADEYSLNYDLLSDPGSEAAKQWGAWGLKQINGVEMTGVLRSTVVIDPEGTVLAAAYNVPAEGSVAAAREVLGV